MNEMEILKERKMCSMCTDCSDEICFKCKRVNGSTLKEIETAFDSAIQALQAQAERDKMRCENCIWHEKEKYFLDDEIPISEQTCFTCTFYGDDVPVGIPVEESHYCSHFEPKEINTK